MYAAIGAFERGGGETGGRVNNHPRGVVKKNKNEISLNSADRVVRVKKLQFLNNAHTQTSQN